MWKASWEYSTLKLNQEMQAESVCEREKVLFLKIKYMFRVQNRLNSMDRHL